MIANWFLDGEHILQLAGGAIVVGFQALNLYRSTRNARNIEHVHQLVRDNSGEILSEVAAARGTLDRIEDLTRGNDRRKGPTFMAGGRRAGDP